MQEYSNTSQDHDDRQVEALILECQPWIARTARKYARAWFRIDSDDFVSIGMLEACKQARTALTKDVPLAYLCKCAKYAMIHEIKRMHKLEPLSLDAPLADDNSMCLADLLPDCSSTAPIADNFSEQALYDALGRLPPRFRAALLWHAGLPGYGASSVKEAAHALGVEGATIQRYSNNALHALRSDAVLCASLGLEVTQ